MQIDGVLLGRIATAHFGTVVTKAIVVGALVGVRQIRIGLRGLLERLFSLLVTRILVGVKLHRELVVRLLERSLVNVFGDAQNFVVVALL